MRGKCLLLLIIMVGTMLITLKTSSDNENQNAVTIDNVHLETKEDGSKLPSDSIAPHNTIIGKVDYPVTGIGVHKLDYHYYGAWVDLDHEAVGDGEWHFHGRFFYEAWVPNAPYDDSITFKKVGDDTWIDLDDRWSGSTYIGGSSSTPLGLYPFRFTAWEEDTWPLPKIDPESVSNGEILIELQGMIETSSPLVQNRYSPSNEVNRWIGPWFGHPITDGDVSHYLKYYIHNSRPTASSISPQNPTIFAGDTLSLTGDGDDADDDSLVYEWDLDYNGVTFGVDSTGKTINPSFTEGTHTIAYRVKDQFDSKSIIVVTTVTANPSDAPFVDQPDEIVYIRGTTGHNITWNPYDDNPNEYFIIQTNSTSINDTQIVMGPTTWDNSSITLDIDGYPLGTYYFTCNVSDNDNHMSSSTVILNVIELDRPTIAHTPNNITFNEGTIDHSITWNVTDENPAHYTITRNGTAFDTGFWNGSTIISKIDSISAGIHIFNCTVYDQFGNSASDTIEVVVLDIISPEIFLTTLTNDTIHQSDTPINVTVWDKHLKIVYYSWDGRSNQSTNESPFQTLLPGDDTHHTLYIYAYDDSSNWVTEKFIFYTDDTPPAISFYSPTAGTNYTSNQIDIIFSGEAEYYWYYIAGIDSDNRSWIPVATRSVNNGTYTIHGFANDSVNNIAHISVTFTIGMISTSSTDSTNAIGWVMSVITLLTTSSLIRRKRVHTSGNRRGIT